MYHVKLFYVQDIQVVYFVLRKPNDDFVYDAEEHTSSQAFNLVPHHIVVQVRQDGREFPRIGQYCRRPNFGSAVFFVHADAL